jgi:thioredoxin reductase
VSYPRERADLVVVGAGPAGLSAACEAAELGLRPVVLDENERGGGQLNKQIHKFFGSGAHGAGRRGFEIAEGLLERCAGLGVDLRLGHLAAGAFEERELMVRGPGGISLLECGALIVAAGAVEKPLAFPGWTLPGVMGAGGAQTLMNLQGVLPGKRVAVVGTGNVGLIVAYQLVQAGAEIAAVLEIDPEVKGYGVHEQRLRLLGVPFLLRHELLKAEGRDCVEGVVVRDLERGDCFRYRVDCVCLAVGLSPLIELPLMLGCRACYDRRLGGWVAWHDSSMRTSREGVYVAGDSAGVEEASVAMEEGRMAAAAAGLRAGVIDEARAEERMRETAARLYELRNGPYNYGRREAKERLWAS